GAGLRYQPLGQSARVDIWLKSHLQLRVRESADALRCRSRMRRTPRRAGRGRGSFLPALLAAPSTGTGVVETSGVRHLRSQFQLLQGNQPRFQGVNGGLCSVPDTDNLVDLFHVVPDGLHTQVHVLCDLGVVHATRDTAENGEVASLQANTGCVHFSSPLKIRWTSSGSWTEFDALCFRYFLLSLRFSFSASL